MCLVQYTEYIASKLQKDVRVDLSRVYQVQDFDAKHQDSHSRFEFREKVGLS